jgi:uncharacterized protein (DUF885 family)
MKTLQMAEDNMMNTLQMAEDSMMKTLQMAEDNMMNTLQMAEDSMMKTLQMTEDNIKNIIYKIIIQHLFTIGMYIRYITCIECRSTRTHYSDSEPTNLCSFSLMQRA